MRQKKAIVSACLLGDYVRYDDMVLGYAGSIS